MLDVWFVFVLDVWFCVWVWACGGAWALALLGLGIPGPGLDVGLGLGRPRGRGPGPGPGPWNRTPQHMWWVVGTCHMGCVAPADCRESLDNLVCLYDDYQKSSQLHHCNKVTQK